MSEEILGSESTQGDVSGLGSVEAPITEAPTEQVENTAIDSSVEQPVEKTLPQSAVQAIAAREKRRGEHAGYERALQDSKRVRLKFRLDNLSSKKFREFNTSNKGIRLQIVLKKWLGKLNFQIQNLETVGSV